MEIRELRIGNYVYKQLKSGQGRKVISKIGCQDIVKIYENTGSFIYTPIQLTEEILLKCGFVDGILSVGDLFLQQFDDDKGFVFITGDADEPLNNRPCKHLHQLQNLYFALTNQELKINL